MAHPAAPDPVRGAVALLGAALALRLFVAATTGIVDDEAYYWVWSTHPAWGYFDHPPAVAWLIAPGVALLGKTALGLRLGPIVVATLAGGALLRATPRPALLVGLLAALPLYGLGGVLATPDLPMLAGWCLALGGAAAGGAGWWVAGLGLGLSGLGKLTGYGLLPLLLLGAPREWRGWLRAAGVALVVWAPNLVWMAQHDWVSWRFQLDHGLGRAPPGLGGLASFLGAQIGLVSPVVFAVFVAWWAVGWRGDRVDRLCWWTSAPVLAWFSFAATRSPAEANWAAAAYVGAALGVSRAGARWVRAAWVGLGTAAALTVLLLVHVYRPIVDLAHDPVARLGEGRTLAASVEAWGIEPVYTSRYQEAAVITWYTGIDAAALPGVDRPDQYDLWPTPWADAALFVRPFRSGPTLSTDAFCRDHGPPNVVSEPERVVDGAALGTRRWQVYEVQGCTPAPAVPPP